MFNLTKTSKIKFLATLIVVGFIIVLNQIQFATIFLYTFKTTLQILLFILIVIIWGVEIQKRIVDSKVKRLFLFIDALMILFNFIKLIKYNLFSISLTSNILWYLYYVPLIFIPLMVLHSTLMINSLSRRSKNILRILYCCAIVLAILILTNDLHHLAFSEIVWVDGVDTYQYYWLYYLVTIWMLVLAVSSISICYLRSKNTLIKQRLWVQWIWIVLAILYCIYYVTGPYFLPRRFLQLPDFMCLVFIGFIEFSIQAGLYPSNSMYSELFDKSSVCAIIRDENENIVYSSSNSNNISKEMQNYVKENGVTLFSDKLVYYEKINKGEIIWMDDVKSINRLTDSLNEIKDQVSGENDLLKAENELKRKQASIKEKNKLYNLIDENLQIYFEKIRNALKGINENSLDYQHKMSIACFYLAYIKRRSNLIILAQQNDYIDTRELYLSVKELLNQISSLGIISNVDIKNEYSINAEALILIYQLVEEVLDDCLKTLKSCLITISCNKEETIVRIQLSGKKMNIDIGDVMDNITALNISVDSYKEEQEYYFTFKYKGVIL